MNAPRQFRSSLPGAERQRKASTDERDFGQPRKAKSVALSAATGAQNPIVTGKLPFSTQSVFDPEQHWIQREQYNGGLLQQVEPIVRTAQMLHLVQDYLFQISRTELMQQSLGKEDARLQEANHARPFNLRRCTKLGGATILSRLQMRPYGICWFNASRPHRQSSKMDGARNQLRATPERKDRPDAGYCNTPEWIEVERGSPKYASTLDMAVHRRQEMQE
jgi:hypothetical protein